MTLKPLKAFDGGERPPVFYSVDSVEKHLIERARSNIVDFILYMSDGQFVPPDHHLEWLHHLLSPEEKYVNLIAFRGSGKTFVLVYTLAYLIGKYPWKTNAIFSSNADLAEARLREIRDIIESARYKNVFPHVHIDDKRRNNIKQFTVWSSRWRNGVNDIGYDQWRSLVSRFGQPRDATLMSAGITGSGIAGRRFTGIVLLDDIHDVKNSATSEQRQKIINIVKGTIMPCMWRDANPKMVSISTRWAEDDFPGVIKGEKRTRTGDFVWKTVEIPIMDEDGNPTWPELWTKEAIEEERDVKGEVMFQLMYMNNAKAASSGEFTIDMFRTDLPDPLPEFKEVYVSCDFASTETLRSDFTVFAAVARDTEKQFKYYVLDVERFKRARISKKVDDLIEFCDYVFATFGRLDGVLMEKADSQAEAQALQEARPDMPIRIIPTKGDKGDRLKPIAKMAQQNRLAVNQRIKCLDVVISEHVGFPSTHDDTCDAIDLPFQQPAWAFAGKVRAKTHKVHSPYLI